MDRRQRHEDIADALLIALQSWQRGIWTALPGIVDTFNPAENTCTVQPALRGLQRAPDSATTWHALPLLIHCPVVFPGGGGFCLTFPLKKGDECLVVFASRCIDAWWQQGGVQDQAELRLHDISDGFVIPGVRSVPRVPASISTTAAQLRNDAGTVAISLEPSGNVQIVTPGAVNVSAASATITAASITCAGDVTVNGALTTTGAIRAPSATLDALALAGIDMTAHRHSVSGGFTGGPSA